MYSAVDFLLDLALAKWHQCLFPKLTDSGVGDIGFTTQEVSHWFPGKERSQQRADAHLASWDVSGSAL